VRPPWQQQGADAELEALQTDVMRFIAILGLCLAAIFSLVHSAAIEERGQLTTPEAPATAAAGLRDSLAASKPVPETILEPGAAAQQEPSARQKPASVARPKLEPGPPDEPPPSRREIASESPPAPVAPDSVPVRGEEETGFSLEFASEAALGQLLARGQVRLYARVDGEFWISQAAGSSFVASAAPGSYYGMHAATVPQSLRRALARAASASPSEWGVQLAPELVDQLERVMGERSGGSLLIGQDGRVRVEAR
jgi:hypothetical protein